MNFIMRNRQKMAVFICFVVCIFLVSINFSFSQEYPKKHVLILNSYYRGYEWSERIEEGIESVLVSKGKNVEVNVEYMDTKRHICGGYIKKLYEVYKDKFENVKFDTIIATDDNALNFLVKHGEELFPNTPVVFCGVKNYEDNMLSNHSLFTGVAEELDIKRGIELALKLHPNTKNIVFITDKNIYKEKLKALLYKYNDLDFIFLENTPMHKIEEKLKTLSKDSLIFFMDPILKDEFRYIMPMNGIQMIAEKSQIPIYSFWDIYLGNGIVGGLLINGQEQGKICGQMVKDILEGEKAENIPIIKESPKGYMFDYDQMKKFSIKPSDLPKGSILINKPISAYSISKEMIYTILILIIMVLTTVIYMLYRSIVQRNEVEKELKDHLRFMNMLMDTIPNPIFYKNKKGIYTGCNKGYEELLGMNRKDIVDCGVHDIFHKELADIYYKMDKELMESGGQQTYEEKIHGKNDTYHDVIFNKAVYKNSNGEDEGIIGVIVDITKRKEMEKALRESEERYSKLIELLPDGIIIFDDKIEFVNRTAVNLLGARKKEEILGKCLIDFVHPDYKEFIKNRINKVVKEKKNVPLLEHKAVRIDHQLIDIETKGIPFIAEGKVKHLSVIRDITERKKAEELQRRIKEAVEQDKLKTEFFANLSHELRTPLNLIFSSIQLLELELKNKYKIDDEKNLNKRLKVLKQNGYRLLRLVNNLIDITKMDSGYFELDIQNYNIVSVVEEITLSVAEYMEQKNIGLQFDTDIEEKIMACDPDKIERIVLNLLSNAIKFTNPGGSVMVNMYDKGESICIKVKDTGIGIPTDKLSMIFERFRQVDKSIRRNHEGSGIGLSLVESLVKMHGGVITVESEYGKGSTFMIELPAKKLFKETPKLPSSNFSQNCAERIDIEFSDIYA